MARACSTCYHAAPMGPQVFECRAHPPSFEPDPAGGAHLRGAWPMVTPTAWCGWHTTEPTGSPPPLTHQD